MNQAYNILFIIHVISVCIAFGLLPVDLIMGHMIRKSEGRTGEITLMRAYLRIRYISGNISLPGILLSGIFMSLIGPGGFFRFGEFPWLGFKQVVMVILLILVFTLVIPSAKTIKTALMSIPEGEKLDDIFVRKKFNVYKSYVLLLQFLILANIVASTYRPFR